MSRVMLTDNGGHLISPINSYHPVFGSGQGALLSTADTDYTLTVSCGQAYRLCSLGDQLNNLGGIDAGIADVTAASNAVWHAAPGLPIVMYVPEKSDGSATRSLHLARRDGSGLTSAQIVQLDDSGGAD